MPHYNKKMISFFMTTKCNLCCRYCYNSNERSRIKEYTIPLEIAKAGINWYFSQNDCRHIRFYGPGEPTQAFESMVNITNYAKSFKDGGDRVTVEIQTNGVFDREVREWLLNNANIIWISFDGMPDIQDYNRPLNPMYYPLFSSTRTSSIIEENVRWLINNTSSQKLMVGARATITNKNVYKQKEMVDYFEKIGIRNIWTDPVFYSVDKKPVNENIEKRGALQFDMNAYIDNYVSSYEYAKNKGIFYGSFLAVNFDGESCYHCRSCSPLAAPHLTPDGYISACDMTVLGKQAFHMNPFIVGKWNDSVKKFDIYYDKVEALGKRKSTNMQHCIKCPVKLHCGGYCLGEVQNETGDYYSRIPEKCKAIIRLYDYVGDGYKYEYLHP